MTENWSYWREEKLTAHLEVAGICHALATSVLTLGNPLSLPHDQDMKFSWEFILVFYLKWMCICISDTNVLVSNLKVEGWCELWCAYHSSYHNWPISAVSHHSHFIFFISCFPYAIYPNIFYTFANIFECLGNWKVLVSGHMEFSLHKCSGPLEFVLHLGLFLHLRFVTLWCNLISDGEYSLISTTLIKHIPVLMSSWMSTRVSPVPSHHEGWTLESLGLQTVFIWISYSNERTLEQGSCSLNLNMLCQIAFHKSKCVYACTVWEQNFHLFIHVSKFDIILHLNRHLWSVISANPINIYLS